MPQLYDWSSSVGKHGVKADTAEYARRAAHRSSDGMGTSEDGVPEVDKRDGRVKEGGAIFGEAQRDALIDGTAIVSFKQRHVHSN